MSPTSKVQGPKPRSMTTEEFERLAADLDDTRFFLEDFLGVAGEPLFVMPIDPHRLLPGLEAR